jgi:hypothetical protein
MTKKELRGFAQCMSSCREFLVAFYRFDAKRFGNGKGSKPEIMLLGTAKLEKRPSIVLVSKKPPRTPTSEFWASNAKIPVIPDPDLRDRERSSSQRQLIRKASLFVSVKLNKFCYLGKSTPVQGAKALTTRPT